MTSKGRAKSTPFSKILVQLARAFKKNKIGYMVFGGQAVLVHGEPRFTQDIDITLGVGPAKSQTILKIVKTLKYQALVENTEQFINETLVLPILEPKFGIRVDLVFSFSPFERAAIKRSKKICIDGEQIHFVSVEDLIVFKMVAGRPRDLEDVRAILLKNPRFGRAHVLRWLKAYDAELDEGIVKKFLGMETSLKLQKRCNRRRDKY